VHGNVSLVHYQSHSMLAIGAFHSHLSHRIRNRSRNKNADSVIIPSDMTSQLQPHDASINKPFKHLVCKHYDHWLNKDNHILTSSGKIKRTSASIIVEWISKAWKEVPINIISKSFLKCCLSNAMQDDIVWDDSKQSGEAASSSENESEAEGSLDKLSD
jgi:hypothetical protein